LLLGGRFTGLLWSMSTEPVQARLCQCEHPLLDSETCLRCGRSPSVIPEAALSPRRLRQKVAWTRPAVMRAIRAFAFFRGRAPVPADWNQRMADWPPRATVEALFGSVEAAARAAGVEPERPPGGDSSAGPLA
jgi:hypothetical protein